MSLKWLLTHVFSPRQLMGYGLILLAGLAFHVVVESLLDAMLIVTGAILVDIAVDMIILKIEKARGDID